MVVALSFLFSLALSNLCVYPWIERAFDALKGLSTLLHGHTLLLGVFIAYFVKKNTSLRQNILKNLRIWERSLISGSNWCLFRSLYIGTWLGEVTSEIGKKKGEKQQPDTGPDESLLNHRVRFRPSPARPIVRRQFSWTSDRTLDQTRRCDHCGRSWTSPARPVTRDGFPGGPWPDFVRVRSPLTGRV
jgi:hypothetical protein